MRVASGIAISPDLMTGRQRCARLLDKGVLAKDTHGSTVRLAPPLVTGSEAVGWMVVQLGEVLAAA